MFHMLASRASHNGLEHLAGAARQGGELKREKSTLVPKQCGTVIISSLVACPVSGSSLHMLDLSVK